MTKILTPVKPEDLKPGDRIRGAFEATVERVVKDTIPFLINWRGEPGSGNWLTPEDLATMTLTRVEPAPVAPTAEELVEIMRQVSVMMISGDGRDALVRWVAKYDAATRPAEEAAQTGQCVVDGESHIGTDGPAPTPTLTPEQVEALRSVLAWAKTGVWSPLTQREAFLAAFRDYAQPQEKADD